ncbi:hypothetical protein LCGC14_0891650 [marine sediment metagenome]|uniref:Zinc-ribbon domain-containing protein n=1 Tax=marine sediment metagenome TaxID=412755 RepID=A0A0F9P3Z1_9ZZZZ
MFCPSCGSELTEPNQSFCSKCGSEIGARLEIPQLRTERPRQVSTNTLQSPPESTSVQIYQQKPMIKEGRPGPYSKKCLVFAIVSIGLAISGLVISTGSVIFAMISWFGFAQNSIGFLLRLIIVIVLNIIGLLFAIESRLDSKKAGELEPVNTVEKIGSIFAIIGIIVNTTSIALALIIAPIPFYFSYSFPKRFL